MPAYKVSRIGPDLTCSLRDVSSTSGAGRGFVSFTMSVPCAEHSLVLTYFLNFIGRSVLRMREGEVKREPRGGAEK